MRVIGQGRWQHPFHFHGNHARVLARDGNLMLQWLADPSNSSVAALAGPLFLPFRDRFRADGRRDLRLDRTGIKVGCLRSVRCRAPGNGATAATRGTRSAPSAGFDPVTKEYCADHDKPMPVTPPNAGHRDQRPLVQRIAVPGPAGGHRDVVAAGRQNQINHRGSAMPTCGTRTMNARYHERCLPRRNDDDADHRSSERGHRRAAVTEEKKHANSFLWSLYEKDFTLRAHSSSLWRLSLQRRRPST